MYGLKPIPFKTEEELDFSAGRKVVPFKTNRRDAFFSKL